MTSISALPTNDLLGTRLLHQEPQNRADNFLLPFRGPRVWQGAQHDDRGLPIMIRGLSVAAGGPVWVTEVRSY